MYNPINFIKLEPVSSANLNQNSIQKQPKIQNANFLRQIINTTAKDVIDV